jgi:hypothetical protein
MLAMVRPLRMVAFSLSSPCQTDPLADSFAQSVALIADSKPTDDFGFNTDLYGWNEPGVVKNGAIHGPDDFVEASDDFVFGVLRREPVEQKMAEQRLRTFFKVLPGGLLRGNRA